MYVNLLLGLVAAILVWFFIRNLVVREGQPEKARPAKRGPGAASRHRLPEAPSIRRPLPEAARDESRPPLERLAAAMADLQDRLRGPDKTAVSWQAENDRLTVRIRGDYREPDSYWKTPQKTYVVRFGPDPFEGELTITWSGQPDGRFILEYDDDRGTREAGDVEECMSRISDFIVDLMYYQA